MLALLPLWLFIVGGSCQGPPPGGPPPDGGGIEFGMVLLSPIYVCGDEASQAYIDASKTDVVRYNDSVSYINGWVYFKDSFHEDTMAEIVVEKEANGRFEKVMTLEICNLCAEMKNPDSNYHVYLSKFGVPDECPFEPGEYPIDNLEADTSELPINSANAGTYVATINIYKAAGDCQGEKTFLGCMKLDCCIEPL